jgi:hypothetical protein
MHADAVVPPEGPVQRRVRAYFKELDGMTLADMVVPVSAPASGRALSTHRLAGAPRWQRPEPSQARQAQEVRCVSATHPRSLSTCPGTPLRLSDSKYHWKCSQPVTAASKPNVPPCGVSLSTWAARVPTDRLEAAAAVMRYFDTSAVHHQADEEVDLFPALIEAMAGSDAVCLRELTASLTGEHRELEQRWRALRRRLEPLACGNARL